MQRRALAALERALSEYQRTEDPRIFAQRWRDDFAAFAARKITAFYVLARLPNPVHKARRFHDPTAEHDDFRRAEGCDSVTQLRQITSRDPMRLVIGRKLGQ